jgi:hypothetical protein
VLLSKQKGETETYECRALKLLVCVHLTIVVITHKLCIDQFLLDSSRFPHHRLTLSSGSLLMCDMNLDFAVIVCYFALFIV